MPTSNLAIAPFVLWLVQEVPAAERRHILDVGAGHGKYCILLREYLNDPPDEISAVEAWPDYVRDHHLVNLYRAIGRGHVFTDDVMHLPESTLDRFDVVLLVDVFEHLTELDGRHLVDRIRGRVVVATPADYFQNPEAGTVWTEDHRSHWPLAKVLEVFGDRVEAASENLGGVLFRLGPRG